MFFKYILPIYIIHFTFWTNTTYLWLSDFVQLVSKVIFCYVTLLFQKFFCETCTHENVSIFFDKILMFSPRNIAELNMPLSTCVRWKIMNTSLHTMVNSLLPFRRITWLVVGVLFGPCRDSSEKEREIVLFS